MFSLCGGGHVIVSAERPGALRTASEYRLPADYYREQHVDLLGEVNRAASFRFTLDYEQWCSTVGSTATLPSLASGGSRSQATNPATSSTVTASSRARTRR
jgi:hypothetical protein